jgi:hypothetical protein
MVREGGRRDGRVLSLVDDNNVYVPVGAFYDRFRRHIMSKPGVVKRHETAFKRTLTDEQRDKLVANATRLNDHIDDMLSRSETGKIFEDFEYPFGLRVILDAIEFVPAEQAKLGDPLTAKEIHEAIERYASNVDKKMYARKAKDFETPRHVAAFLKDHSDHHHVRIEKDGDEDIYRYTLEYKKGSFKQLDVTEIDDVLELPCLQNLYETMQNERPRRYPLFQFVRILLCLDADIEQEDIVEWFSQFHWFDRQTTEYQVDYERREGGVPDPEDPSYDFQMPVGCQNDNDKWTRFCIGMENCEYSIYQSLPMAEPVHEKLESETGRQR